MGVRETSERRAFYTVKKNVSEEDGITYGRARVKRANALQRTHKKPRGKERELRGDRTHFPKVQCENLSGVGAKGSAVLAIVEEK